MRYFGGGIGHLWQGVPQRVTYNMDVDAEPEDDGMGQTRVCEPFNGQVLEPLVEGPDQAEVDESLSGSDSDSDGDSSSDLDSNATWSNCDSDDDDLLGPEDGESSDDDDNLYSSF